MNKVKGKIFLAEGKNKPRKDKMVQLLLDFPKKHKGKNSKPLSTKHNKDTLKTFVRDLVGKYDVIFDDTELTEDFILDIYVPQERVAIAYCDFINYGEVTSNKPNRYNYDKMVACNEKSVRLLTIFEDEYRDKQEVVESRIRNALGKPLRRIYARKCELKEISYKEASAFLDKYHLQGKGNSKIRWGLFFDGELVQVITCGSPSRNHTSRGLGKVLEIKRFASYPGDSVVGGFGRLFKAAKKYAQENQYDTIKSYCDMRYSALIPVYEVLGFTLKGFTKYTPHYVLNDKRIRNQGLRKTPEERLTGKTEWELRREQGYNRVFDCGHRTYVNILNELV